MQPDLARWLVDPARCRDNLGEDVNQPLALAAALRAVVCHNTRLRQSSGTVEQARAALQREQSRWQPSVALSGGVDGNRGAPSTGSTALSLEWVLFDFGATSAAINEARHALLATQDGQGSEWLTAVADAAALYATAQASYWRFEAAHANVRTALESLRMAKARLGAGAASQLEKLQAETALSQTRLEHARALNAWFAARGELALAMGWPATRPLVLAPVESAVEVADEPALDIDALLREAQAQHPRIAAARARQAQVQAQLSGYDSQRWGSVTLGIRSGQSRALTSGALGGSAGTTSGGSLQWNLPLLDRGVLQAQRQDAQGRASSLAADLDEAQRLTALQVWQGAQALVGERAALRASRSLLETAEATFRVSGERFRLGVGVFTDLLQAQTAVASARLQWAESRANLTRSHWRLAAAAGRFGSLRSAVESGREVPR